MRVLFLGAGASIEAGYPPAGRLLKDIENEMAASPSVNTIAAWTNFTEWRASVQGMLRSVVQSENPEIVLSLMDLLLETREDRDASWWRRLGSAYGRGEMEAFREEPRPDEDEPLELPDVESAIEGVESALDHYFSKLHWLDWQEREAEREYLKTELATLEPGDVVLTTNWDTLAGRSLSELGLWYPMDGYGWRAPLERFGLQSSMPRLDELQSSVKVLKLHGSTGWHSLPRRRSWYLRWANFLQFLPIRVDEEQILVQDPRENVRPDGFHEPRVLIRPSYLKKLHSPVLQEIWSIASQALRSADEVKIIGYSLPESDTAIRVLLGPLRTRLADGQLEVSVLNPDHQALNRWRNLLGDRAELVRREFGPGVDDG